MMLIAAESLAPRSSPRTIVVIACSALVLLVIRLDCQFATEQTDH
jgi:hypothetical protein